MSVISSSDWDLFLQNFPNAHILQTSSWGVLKARYGWKSVTIQSGTSGAQILFRRLPFGFSIGYIPKGPVGYINEELLEEITSVCRKEKSIVIYLEPDACEDSFDGHILRVFGFRSSEISIQPRRTIILSLDKDEKEWLDRMKQKTRYNIRLAEKKEITVELSNDISAFNDLMKTTSERDQFGVHDECYYQDAYAIFSQKGHCELLEAKYNETPVAALMMFFRGRRAWYFYGASSDTERNRMPTYLLQWEAMRLAARKGCEAYDLWGVPDHDEQFLEKHFEAKADGLWGVYRFKRGFGGTVIRSAGVFEKVLKPSLFKIYRMAYKFRKRTLA